MILQTYIWLLIGMWNIKSLAQSMKFPTSKALKSLIRWKMVYNFLFMLIFFLKMLFTLLAIRLPGEQASMAHLNYQVPKHHISAKNYRKACILQRHANITVEPGVRNEWYNNLDIDQTFWDSSRSSLMAFGKWFRYKTFLHFTWSTEILPLRPELFCTCRLFRESWHESTSSKLPHSDQESMYTSSIQLYRKLFVREDPSGCSIQLYILDRSENEIQCSLSPRQPGNERAETPGSNIVK